MLKFNIRHQSISRVDHFRPVEKSVKYLKARFFFLTDEWDEYEKRCLCHRDGQTYEKDIIDGECEIPWEVLLGGPFELCIVGKSGDTIVPTAAVEIDLGITLPGGPEGAEPTPSQYDEMNKRIDALAGTAVLHTEQSLTDEQRAQARANIAKFQYDWREVTAGYNAYTVADASIRYNTLYPFDIDAAIGCPSVVNSKINSIAAMVGSANIMLGATSDALLIMQCKRVVQDFDALSLAGIVPKGVMFIGVRDSATDEVGTAFSITTSSDPAYTHSITILAGVRTGSIFYNLSTGAYRIVLTMPGTSDNTLSKGGYAADAKAVGDALALKADKVDPIEVLIEEDMLPAVHENGAILTDENGNVILRY